MRTPPSIGRILCALEIAERAQQEGLFLTESLRVDRDQLICRMGDVHYVLNGGMGPNDIVAAARRSGVPANPVPDGFADDLGIEDPASVWSAWAQLHYDLGASEGELRVTEPPLWFVSVTLVGRSAAIAVTDGVTIGTEVVPLGEDVRRALPVDLAFHFHGAEPPMTFR